MFVLSLEYKTPKKYILYSINDSEVTIHYVYKIYEEKNITELVKYYEKYNQEVITLSTLVFFNKKEPLKSIDNFYKIALLF